MAGNPKIGLDQVYVAPLIEGSDVVGGTPSWGTPVLLAGAVKAQLNPNGSVATDWGDNGPFFIGSSVGNLQMALELIDFDPDVHAAVLGASRANGITVEGSLDQSPWYAMGFRVWLGGKDSLGNNIYEYFWCLKGKFSKPEMGGDTKKESLAFGHTTLNAEFARLNVNNAISTHARTDKGASSALIAAWFTAPVYKTTVDLGALSVVIAKATADVSFTFSKVGGGLFNMAEASFVLGSSALIAVLGAQVPGTVVWTGEGTASVVATFTPTTPFGTATVLASVTTDVKDENGVACAAAAISISYP